jgi:2-dehydro-3-deoxyphosphogluconate aldolase / (4S)-4-hydroxy-2-oxoglutarate aldolase
VTSPLETLAEVRVLPVVSLAEPTSAAALADVLAESGLPVIEITLRTERALDAVRAVARAGTARVGVGTVMHANQVRAAADAGAEFVVTPGFDPAVVRACLEHRIPVIAGIATATEILQALSAGVEVLKLFPATVLGGPALIEALSAPFPQIRFVPTGGITAQTAPDYLAQPSVLAIGGSWMVPRRAILANDFTAISALSRAAAQLPRARHDRTGMAHSSGSRA